MIRSPNYDVAYKIEICEEYLRCIANGDKISKAQFAQSKDIKYTTFLDWLNTYKKYELNKENDGAILTSNRNEVSVPKFIEISDKTIEEVKPVIDTNKVVLKYKGIALEFEETSLDKALEIIKRW